MKLKRCTNIMMPVTAVAAANATAEAVGATVAAVFRP